jgi:hypothetical protein
MLRLKILASSIPLVIAAVFARGEWLAIDQPCITIGATTVQMATAPWLAQTHVSFTTDPARANVRVQIVDTPETADLAIVEDTGTTLDGSCGAQASIRSIGIASVASETEPVIYLSQDADADYRIYVRSRSVSARDAAALIVGASGRQARLASAL